MKSLTWKNLLKIAAFAAGVFIIIALLDIPFRGGYWYLKGFVADRDSRIAGIQEEPEGQIDVLNVGDSLADIAITPVEMYRDCGVTSYVMGRDLQKCIETYYAIKLAGRNQKIKVVLWEVHNLCKHYPHYEPYIIGVSEYAKYRSQFIKYHYVWKTALEGKGMRKYFKGYVVNEEVTPYEGDASYMDPNVTRVFKVPSDQMYAFKKIYKLCQEEGIKLVLYAVPSPHCYDMEQHNGYAKLANEYGLDFLDANLELDRLGIDFANDYSDKGDHLNLYGTRKMTKYLSEYLVNECGLEDHRNDPAYQSWSDLLPAYEQEVLDMKGTSYPKMEREQEERRKELQEEEDLSGSRDRKETRDRKGSKVHKGSKDRKGNKDRNNSKNKLKRT